MFCPKCGREYADGAAFCAGCGATLNVSAPAKKKTLSLAAGIIEIAFGCLGLGSVILAEIVLADVVRNEEDFPRVILLIPLAMIIPAVVSIIGGIFTLKRSNWAMALIGSIALLLTSSIPGVVALVLVILGRDEFEGQPPSR